MDYDSIDTTIPSLGERKIASPLQKRDWAADVQRFVSDSDRILIDVNLSSLTERAEQKKELPSFELAGPRQNIYFDQ